MNYLDEDIALCKARIEKLQIELMTVSCDLLRIVLLKEDEMRKNEVAVE